MMNTINALEEIERSKGYEFALMTTFNIDVDFFERHIIGRLIGAGTRKIGILVDSQELNKGINSTWKKTLLMGNRYSVNPVKIAGSFHPKVLLLMSVDKAKLIISSANYTKSGYSTNNEIFNVFEWNNDRSEYLHIIQYAYSFFRKAYDLSYALDSDLFKEIEELPYIRNGIGTPIGDAYLIHNVDDTIMSQIQELVHDVTSVDIAVPFYDNGLTAVAEIKKSFPDAAVNCYVQNHKSRFNVEKAKQLDSFVIKAFSGFIEPKSQSFYHGKVFRFVTTDSSWVLYGSANCTGAALLSTPKSGGNVECCVLEKGNQGEFDYYFDNMLLQEADEEVVCDLLEYRSEEASSYYFKYGAVLDDAVTLKIGVIGTYNEPKVKYREEELHSTFDPEDRTITAIIPREIFSNWEEIFTLKIADRNSEHELKGWLNNTTAIKVYRESEAGHGEFAYTPDAEGDERIANILRVIQNLALGYEALKRKHDIERIIEKKEKAVKMPEMDYEDAPEGIIDYVIPPRMPTAEEFQEYQNNKKAERIARGIVSAFLNRNAEERQKKIKKYKEQKSAGNTSKKRNATSAEQQGRRYITAAIKRMCDEENLKEDTAEHFLQGFCGLAQTMSQYSSTFIEDMFDPRFIVDKRWDLLNAVLKIEDDFTEEQIKAIIQMAVETHYIELKESKGIASDRWDVVAMFRRMDDRFNIREEIESIITDETTLQIGDHIEDVFFEPDQYGKIDGIRPSRKEIIGYIEASIGYRTWKQIEELVYSRFGETAVISTENRMFLVSCHAPLKEWFNGDKWLMNEIEKHCRHYKVQVDSIVLDIDGIKIPDGPDPAVRLRFTKQMGGYQIKKEVKHRSGLVYDENNNIVKASKEAGSTEKPVLSSDVKLHVGDTVKHKKFGEAQIISIENKDSGNTIKLRLSDGSEKKFGEEILRKNLIM